jgi:hypothetical protein
MDEFIKKHRGRPFSLDKRTVSVSVRMSPGEAAALDLARGMRQRGAYLRDIFANNAPRPIPAINIAAWQDLARASSNLNQLARHINSNGQASITEIQNALEAFRDSLIGIQP